MIIKWSKVQVNDIMAFLYILYNTREPCACPRAGPKKMACARARPRARPRTSVATALLINEINETHSNQGGKQNRKHNATTNWTNWREQNVGENAKKKKMRVGGWKRRKKKIKVARLWYLGPRIPRRTIDHQSGLNVLLRTFRLFKRFFFFFWIQIVRVKERRRLKNWTK